MIGASPQWDELELIISKVNKGVESGTRDLISIKV